MTKYSEPEAPNWSAKRLLHIEDDPSCQILVKEYLRDSGIHITNCKSEKDILGQDDLLKTHDLILLDVMLPDVSGLFLCRHFNQVAPGIPIIMHTAVNEPNLLSYCVKSGAREIMLKPVEIDLLLKSLGKYLN